MKAKLKANVLILADIILVNISIVLAYLLRFDGRIFSQTHIDLDSLIKIAIAATLVKILSFWFFKLYESLWTYAGTYELIILAEATAISNFIMFFLVLVSDSGIPRSIFIITFFTDTALIGGVRFLYRTARRLKKAVALKNKNPRRVLIVGGGEAGAVIIKELKQNPGLNSIPVAIIDDDSNKIGRKLNGIPVVGNRKAIVNAVKDKRIDEIIIAIPSAARKAVNEIYGECSKTRCKVKILPSVCQLIDEPISIKKVRNVDIEDLLEREPVKFENGEIASYIYDKVVLVTGGGGSIGSELCRQIAAFKPRQLIILDNYENSAYDIQNELQYKYPGLKLAVVIASIREKPTLENVFKKYIPNVVFHAAAHKHVPLMESNPTEAIKNNVFGTLNVAECADKYGVKKFVLISSDKAVNPTNIMGATKRIAEMIIQSINKSSSTEFAAVRFGNVLGSNGSVIPLFKKQIERGGPVTVTHPEITRFFMTIPEAVQLVLQAGAMANGGEIFVLDMGQPVKIYELARNLIKLSGFEPDVDIKIVFTGLRPGEKLYEELLLDEEGLQMTRNKKIYIVKPVFTDLTLLRREIAILNDIIINNTDDIKNYVSNIVPAYKWA